MGDRQQSLRCLDIPNGRVRRSDPTTGSEDVFGVGKPVDGCCPGSSGGLPVASRAPRTYQVLVQVFPACGRRSSSLVPPHTPWSCLVSSANARHCRRTMQRAQIAFAWVT